MFLPTKVARSMLNVHRCNWPVMVVLKATLTEILKQVNLTCIRFHITNHLLLGFRRTSHNLLHRGVSHSRYHAIQDIKLYPVNQSINQNWSVYLSPSTERLSTLYNGSGKVICQSLLGQDATKTESLPMLCSVGMYCRVWMNDGLVWAEVMLNAVSTGRIQQWRGLEVWIKAREFY